MICKPEDIEIHAIHLCLNALMPQEHPSGVCFALCTGGPASEKHLATVELTAMRRKKLTKASMLKERQPLLGGASNTSGDAQVIALKVVLRTVSVAMRWEGAPPAKQPKCRELAWGPLCTPHFLRHS